MKRLLKCFSLAAAVLVLFAGCNQLGVSDATVEGLGASDSVRDGYCALAISADGMVASEKRSAARTINPTSLEGDTTTITKYVLKGKNVSTGAQLGTITNGNASGIEIDLTNWKATEKNSENQVVDKKDSNGNQQYKVDIPFGAWELTLEAYDSADNKLLQGNNYVDLKTSKQEVYFKLTTKGVTTAGSVDVKGTFEDEGKEAKYFEAGLYDDLTGELKYPTTLVTKAVSEKSFAFDQNAVAPGRYSLQVKFYDSEASATRKQVGYWEDIIVVAPGRTTEDKTIKCGNIINQKPATPTNLRAYLKDGSEDADGYEVILTWNDKSNNEENFVIYLDEYEITADPSNASREVENKIYTTVLGVKSAAETTVDGVKVLKEKFFESDFYAGGSVRASSKEAVIKLPYNRIFEVSIRAENFVGESIYTTADSSASPAVAEVAACPRVTTAPATAAPDNEPAAPANATQYTANKGKINRLTINYNLEANGTLILRSGTGADATSKTVTDFYTDYKNIYDIVAADRKLSKVLLAIDNSVNTKNNLSKDGYNFDKWVNLDGSAFADTAVLTYKGIDVLAKYDTDTLVSWAVSDTYNNIKATVTYDGTEYTPTNSVVTIPDATANKALTIVVSYVDKDGNPITTKTIDWVKVSIRGGNNNNINTGKESGAEAEITKKQVERLGATNTVVVKAHVSGEKESKYYSCTFSLDLNR